MNPNLSAIAADLAKIPGSAVTTNDRTNECTVDYRGHAWQADAIASKHPHHSGSWTESNRDATGVADISFTFAVPEPDTELFPLELLELKQ